MKAQGAFVDLIFVYGTLREDVHNEMYHVLTKHTQFVGDAIFQGGLYDVGEYPGVVPSQDSKDAVIGEVYALHQQRREAVLALLDDYEGCSKDETEIPEYRREKRTVALQNGENVEAWIYLYNRDVRGLKLVPSGDYLDYRRSRAPQERHL